MKDSSGQDVLTSLPLDSEEDIEGAEEIAPLDKIDPFMVHADQYPKVCTCGFVAYTARQEGGHKNKKGSHKFSSQVDLSLGSGNGGSSEKPLPSGKAQFFLPVALRSRSPAAIELAGKHVMLYEWLFKPHGVSLSDFVWECIEDVFASRGIDIGIILREDGQNGHGSGQIDDRPDFRAEENRVPAG